MLSLFRPRTSIETDMSSGALRRTSSPPAVT
jgi:hypothetical protein